MTLRVFPTENDLVARLRKGDVNAFDQVYAKYAPKLYAFSFKYLRSKEEAEELVQSVFLKVWENRQKLRSDTSLKSFLFTIAYNEICNLFRQRNYLRKFVETTLISNREGSDEPEGQIDALFLLEQLNRILAKLPEKQRIIFVKSRQEGKSTKEIASELGLTAGTVDNYISESLKFIRSQLRENDFPLLIFLLFFFG
ncbi:MAG: RNA polymerase sigma-70 factor [Mariniphaga sp.]